MGTIETSESQGRPNRRGVIVASVATWAVIVVLASAAYFSSGAGLSFMAALTGPIVVLSEFQDGALFYPLVPSLVAIALVVWGVWADRYFRVVLGSILGAFVWSALSLLFAILLSID